MNWQRIHLEGEIKGRPNPYDVSPCFLLVFFTNGETSGRYEREVPKQLQEIVDKPLENEAKFRS